MDRRAPRRDVKSEGFAELTPAEALMLRLENIKPATLERMGAEEELRRAASASSQLAFLLDAPSPIKSVGDQFQSDSPKLTSLSSMTATAADHLGRPTPRDWARVFGNSMAGYGLRHGDRVRIDHDVAPSHGSIVLAEVEGIGRVMRKLEIIGGIHVLTADPGIEPIAVDDLSRLIFHGVVVAGPAR